jgi:restriction endonuclease Mrr
VTTSLNDAQRRALRQKARSATLDALQALEGEARREVILERALADGGFSSRELAAPPPERAGEKYARLVDHDLSWALTNLKRDGLVENPRWGTWRLTNAALPPVEAATDAPVSAERLAELCAMPYRLYLGTPEWRRTRAAALLRAGEACSLDVTHTDALEVHHRTYERLGAELVTDLVVLCHSCHMLHHVEHGRPRREGSAVPLPRSAAEYSPAVSSEQSGKRPKSSLLRRLLAN